MFDEKTILEMKAHASALLTGVVDALKVIDRLDISLDDHEVTFYKVKDIIRTDIKPKKPTDPKI